MWLTDLRIVLPEQTLECGALRVAGGRITDVIAGAAPAGARAVDCRGLIAIPGLIDLHGDMIERELEPRPGVQFPIEMAIYELDKRLAANGVTTAYTAVSFHEIGIRKNLRTPERGRAIALTLAALRHRLLVDLRLHARFEVSQPVLAPVVGDLLEQGAVQLLSLNDHTPGQGQWRDIDAYIERGAVARGISREEFAALTHARIERARQQLPSLEAIEAVAALAVRGRVPIASHDDDTPEKVAEVSALGATISEFPVTLEAARAARARGMHVVMGAPNMLRGESHAGNLSAHAALVAGLVDILASDYAPSALLQAAFGLAAAGVLPLHAAVALISGNAAAALGLHDRGAIAVGRRADLALVEDGPYPRVRATIRRGLPVYWDGVMAVRARGPVDWQEASYAV